MGPKTEGYKHEGYKLKVLDTYPYITLHDHDIGGCKKLGVQRECLPGSILGSPCFGKPPSIPIRKHKPKKAYSNEPGDNDDAKETLSPGACCSHALTFLVGFCVTPNIRSRKYVPHQGETKLEQSYI